MATATNVPNRGRAVARKVEDALLAVWPKEGEAYSRITLAEKCSAIVGFTVTTSQISGACDALGKELPRKRALRPSNHFSTGDLNLIACTLRLADTVSKVVTVVKSVTNDLGAPVDMSQLHEELDDLTARLRAWQRAEQRD